MIETTEHSWGTLVRMAHGKASALDIAFLTELERTFTNLAATTARAVVLTGTGGIFSAGVDLVRLRDGGPDYLQAFMPAMARAFHAVYVLDKPVVAAINGHAIAGGCVLACACDHRIMARGRGRIGVPELQVGVPFPWLPLEIVRHTLAPHHAQEALLLGDTYDPDQALARGFVNELMEPGGVLDRAIAVAARLGAVPPAAFSTTKAALRAPVLAAMAREAAAFDSGVQAAWDSPEVRDAVRAYVGKTLGRQNRGRGA